MDKYARRQIAVVHGHTHVGAGADSLAVGFSGGLLQFTGPICLEFVSCRVLFPAFGHEELHVSAGTKRSAERDESALPNQFCGEPGYDPQKEFFFFLERHRQFSNTDYRCLISSQDYLGRMTNI